MSDTPPAAPEAPEVPKGDGPKAKGIKGALGKKIGPLPLGAWLLAVAGGVVVAVIIRRRSLDGGPADATEEGVVANPWDQSDAGGTLGGVGGVAGSGGGTVTQPDTRWQDPVSPATPDAALDEPGNGGPTVRSGHVAKAKAATTNVEWRAEAQAALVKRGFSAGAVQKALQDYVQGKKLTAAEARISSAAVTLVGPPPKGVNRATEAGDIHKTQNNQPAKKAAPKPAPKGGGGGGGASLGKPKKKGK